MCQCNENLVEILKPSYEMDRAWAGSIYVYRLSLFIQQFLTNFSAFWYVVTSVQIYFEKSNLNHEHLILMLLCRLQTFKCFVILIQSLISIIDALIIRNAKQRNLKNRFETRICKRVCGCDHITKVSGSRATNLCSNQPSRGAMQSTLF